MNSPQLLDRVHLLLQDRALPFDADELVAETFARFSVIVHERSWRDADLLYGQLGAMAKQVVEGAIADLLAFVPGAGLQPYFAPGVAELAASRDRALAATRSFSMSLSSAEYLVLLAQALLRLGVLDRRLLLQAGPPVSEASEQLSRGAARRRLQEELERSLLWFDLEQGIVEESRIWMGRSAT
jgi:hypothetical protein